MELRITNCKDQTNAASEDKKSNAITVFKGNHICQWIGINRIACFNLR